MAESARSLEAIAYDAFVYAFPMLEQVKTVNGMIQTMGLEFNQPGFNQSLPWENIGQPIVAPNLTSMTGGVLLDTSHGPVTLEVPEVTDRYIVFQCIDGFTHNFHYIGITRADGGKAGRVTFHRPGQDVNPNATLVMVETDHAVIVIHIDIADESELPRLREIMDGVNVVDAPAQTRPYPTYDPDQATSPDFVNIVNDILTQAPDVETDLFSNWASIGMLDDVDLTGDQRAEVQAGIDWALSDIAEQSKTATSLGNGWIGATTLFGTREFLDGNHMNRAIGAYFGLWGNSNEEASYFITHVEGDSTLHFGPDDLPPLLDVGFWSLTIHDADMLVRPNEFDSYVITMRQIETTTTTSPSGSPDTPSPATGSTPPTSTTPSYCAPTKPTPTGSATTSPPAFTAR